MDHLEASNRLASFVAEELGLEKQGEMRLHLQHCEECRDWIAAFGFLKRNLSSEPIRTRHPSCDDLAKFALSPESLSNSLREMCECHLRVCESCREEVENVQQAVASVPRDESARDYQATEPDLRPPSPLWLSWAALFVLVVGLVALIHFGSLDRQEPVRISGRTLGGSESVVSKGSIAVDLTVVSSGSTVTLRSGGEVSFGEGFSIDDGAGLRVISNAERVSGIVER